MAVCVFCDKATFVDKVGNRQKGICDDCLRDLAKLIEKHIDFD